MKIRVEFWFAILLYILGIINGLVIYHAYFKPDIPDHVEHIINIDVQVPVVELIIDLPPLLPDADIGEVIGNDTTYIYEKHRPIDYKHTEITEREDTVSVQFYSEFLSDHINKRNQFIAQHGLYDDFTQWIERQDISPVQYLNIHFKPAPVELDTVVYTEVYRITPSFWKKLEYGLYTSAIIISVVEVVRFATRRR